MLRITVHRGPDAVTFKLEGKLAGPWVRELEECWTSAQPGIAGHAAVIDLAQVDFIDAAGKQLLGRLHEQGAALAACTPMNKAVVEQILSAAKAGVLLVAAVLALSMGASQARAQTTPLRLTLKEAVQTALRQNPQIQIAVLNLAESQDSVIVARSSLLPGASLGLTEREQRFNIEALIGGKFPGVAQHAGPFATFQASGNFSVPLLDLTAWRRWKASQHVVGATSAQSRTVREQITLLVVSQYLGALRASADVAAAQSRVTLAQALYDQALDLQRSGVGTGIDTLRSNVELQNEKQRLIVAQTQEKTSLYGLARLLNLDPRQNIELGDTVSFFQTPPAPPDHTLEAAFANRPELRALESQARAAELRYQAAGAARYPTVTGEGFWGYQGLSPQTSIPAYTYQISMNLPLFTGGRIAAERSRARLEENKIASQTEEERSQIALEVKTALAQLEAARNEVDVANLGVKLAREEVNQARDRFQAGVANNIEVISAQDALSRANDNQIVALYRYNQARADLARATGQMENLYAK